MVRGENVFAPPAERIFVGLKVVYGNLPMSSKGVLLVRRAEGVADDSNVSLVSITAASVGSNGTVAQHDATKASPYAAVCKNNRRESTASLIKSWTNATGSHRYSLCEEDAKFVENVFETSDLEPLTMDDPDPLALTTTERVLGSTGVVISVVGFACIGLGLSLRSLQIAVPGYILAPTGLLIFIGFLLVYQTSRRTMWNRNVIFRIDLEPSNGRSADTVSQGPRQGRGPTTPRGPVLASLGVAMEPSPTFEDTRL